MTYSLSTSGCAWRGVVYARLGLGSNSRATPLIQQGSRRTAVAAAERGENLLDDFVCVLTDLAAHIRVSVQRGIKQVDYS